MKQQTLVLVPGMLNNAVLWSTVAPALRDKVEVVTPTFSTQDSVTAMAEVALACTPPGPFALAGFSMGGWVAQEIVWVKDSLVLSRADYQWRHEQCLYAKRHGRFWQHALMAAAIVLTLPFQFVRRRRRGEEQAIYLKLRGWYDGIRGRPIPTAELGLE